MADVVNDKYQAPDGTWRWEDVLAKGINGRGRKRDGVTKSIGGKSVTIGQDVTNQEEETKAL